MSKHFAVGLVVDVRDGAKPTGWGDDPFIEDVPKYRRIEVVAPTDADSPHGSFMVGGWFWLPEDIEVV